MKTKSMIITLLALFAMYGCSQIEDPSTNSDKFLVGIFWPPVWEHTNPEQYQTIKEANVDYIQNVLGGLLDTEERNIRMLELAEQNGLTMYVADPRVRGSEDDIIAMMDTYGKYKAVSGYYIVDEPGINGLDDIARRYKTILSYDKNVTPYVNLFPHWAGPVAEDYENAYVGKWIELCGKENMKYLSFDSYPFMHDGTFRESHYINLDIIRKAGLNNNIKTSCYTQSVGIPGAYRRPDATDLRYSAFSSLAYGIKNIVWFTYWTPTNRGEVFTNAVIDSLGNRTDLYEPFKKINGEMKQLGKTLVQLDAKEVYHTGNTPEGCLPLPDNFVFVPQSFEGDFIVSYFTDKKNGKEYVMVVNKSLNKDKKLHITLNDRYKKVKKVSPVTGKPDQLKLTGKSFDDALPPGDAALYHIQ
ncbi:MAG: hypothetical protein LBQ60_11225 [Bacteroidales bacterium]|jgi:hypothetical protein|nr:hypothetical protein [Bacteroidales bacterium]